MFFTLTVVYIFPRIRLKTTNNDGQAEKKLKWEYKRKVKNHTAQEDRKNNKEGLGPTKHIQVGRIDNSHRTPFYIGPIPHVAWAALSWESTLGDLPIDPAPLPKKTIHIIPMEMLDVKAIQQRQWTDGRN